MMKAATELGGRHVSKLARALALVGVPVAIVVATGGSHTIGFWIVALVWLAAAFYGAMLLGFFILLVISPVVFHLEEVVPDRVDAVGKTITRGFLLVVALGLYVTTADLGGMAEVRLPTPWPTVGALIVLGVGVLVSCRLMRLARWLEPSKWPSGGRRHGIAEPDEEFWSDQPVIAWRAWSWDGWRLHGVHSRWLSEAFVATCKLCETVPSWDHVCGVYAVKEANDVQMFHGVAAVVGRVEMWGDVIEHEDGYRASHARIIDLWVGDHWRAQRIQDAYPAVDIHVGTPRLSGEVA